MCEWLWVPVIEIKADYGMSPYTNCTQSVFRVDQGGHTKPLLLKLSTLQEEISICIILEVETQAVVLSTYEMVLKINFGVVLSSVA